MPVLELPPVSGWLPGHPLSPGSQDILQQSVF